MNAMSAQSALLKSQLGSPVAPSAGELEVQQKFQDFVAGTFYSTMLKALRTTQHKPAYFHGGQSEEIFQARLDQQFSDTLARSHGAHFASPLYRAYAAQTGLTLDQQA